MRIDETNYVDRAEQAIIRLQQKKGERGIATTSKIRNLLAMAADIYNDVVNSKDEKLSRDVVGRINYMKLRFYYEAGRYDAGRESTVKNFLEEANVFEIINEIGDSRKNYILFNHYLEALVAFRKYHVGKDE